MSWYANFYLGIMDENKKIKPLGYTLDGELRCITYYCRSSNCDLHELFSYVNDEMITDELRKEFEYEDYNNEERIEVKYLPLSQLPKGNYIKSGYFLIEDIEQYLASLRDECYFEGFYEKLLPEEFAIKLQSELAFGKPSPKKDCDGRELEYHTCADYGYFMYPNYDCNEYESFIIRTVADIIMPDYRVPDGSQLVVLETEG